MTRERAALVAALIGFAAFVAGAAAWLWLGAGAFNPHGFDGATGVYLCGGPVFAGLVCWFVWRRVTIRLGLRDRRPREDESAP